MSQRTVQILAGKLVTDDAFRRRFEEDRAEVLRAMSAIRQELTKEEREALLLLDLSACERFARTLDPRIRKWNLDCPTGREPRL